MSDNPIEHDDDGGLAVQEAKPKLKKPPMYTVLLLNDDFTPMDFVLSILKTIIFNDSAAAVRIQTNVHHRGIGLCGDQPNDVNETPIPHVLPTSQKNQHPIT